MNKIIRFFASTGTALMPYGALKLVKISKIFGHGWSFFTATNIVTPVLGAYVSFAQLGVITAARTAWHLLFFPSVFGFFYHLPTLAAAYYFKGIQSENRALWAVIPLVCMALFIANPVGAQAWGYTLYWLIPAGIAMIPYQSVFLAALASTFTAHAVGSVLFIWSTPLSAGFWMGLIPVVAAERLFFALGITTLYYVIEFIKHRSPYFVTRSVRA